MKLRDVMDQVDVYVRRAEVSVTKDQVLQELKCFRDYIKGVLRDYQIVKRPPRKSNLQ